MQQKNKKNSHDFELNFNQWDSEQLGFRCGSIVIKDLPSKKPADDLFKEIVQLMNANRDISFITLKIPCSYPDLLNALLKNTADLIDTEFIYKFSGQALSPRCIKKNGKIIFVDKYDPEFFLPLAKEMRWSRYFLDKRIPNDKAESLWQSSIRNHCQGRSDKVAVHLFNGTPTGLVTINFLDSQVIRLFIVGVLPEFQGRGIGSELLDAVAQKYGTDYEINVETSCRNVAANTIYKKVGFVLSDARHILHKMQ